MFSPSGLESLMFEGGDGADFGGSVSSLAGSIYVDILCELHHLTL